MTEHIYPNALAKLKVSMKDMSIMNIGETDKGAQQMAPRKNSKKHTQTKNPEVDEIWKNLGLGSIDLSYAACGYTLDGRLVLNQDELINLLINYGFSMEAIMAFIDDYAVHSKSNENSPIIMYTINTARIMAEISLLHKNKKK